MQGFSSPPGNPRSYAMRWRTPARPARRLEKCKARSPLGARPGRPHTRLLSRSLFGMADPGGTCRARVWPPGRRSLPINRKGGPPDPPTGPPAKIKAREIQAAPVLDVPGNDRQAAWPEEFAVAAAAREEPNKDLTRAWSRPPPELVEGGSAGARRSTAGCCQPAQRVGVRRRSPSEKPNVKWYRCQQSP